MASQPPKSMSELVGAGSAIAVIEGDYVKRLCDDAASMGVPPAWVALACIDVAMEIEDENALVCAVESVADRVNAQRDQIPAAEADNQFETERWKRLALYLVACHTATSLHEVLLSSTSKSSRDRSLAICNHALNALDGAPTPTKPLELMDVRTQLSRAIDLLNRRALDNDLRKKTKKA